MSLNRFLAGLAVACALVSQGVPARAQDNESPMQRAEEELSKAAHTDPSHPDQSSDPLTIDPDLAWFTLAVFIILLVVLKKFAWGPILQSLESREHSIANHIAEAQRSHEEAKRLLAEYEQRLAGAAQEVRALLDEPRRDAEHSKQGILTEAKASADAERVRALHDIESAADQAMESLAQRSAQLAVDLAGKILQARLSKDDHARLIQEAMSKFPTSSSSN